MKRTALLIIDAVLSLLLSACIKPTRESVQIMVDESNNNEVIELYLDDSVEINLQDDPADGYEWTVEKLDKTILETSGEPGQHDDRFVMEVRAIAVGETSIKMTYQNTSSA